MTEIKQPFDRDAENAVIAACLLSPESLPSIRDTIKGTHFFDANCRLIYEAACSVDDSGSKIDAITVACAMRGSGTLDAIGGTDTLRKMFDLTPDAAHIDSHCSIVVDKARQRAIYEVCRKHLVLSSGEVRSVSEYCDQIETELLEATDPGDKADSPQMVGEILRGVLPAITERQDRTKRIILPGTSTGIYELDTHLGGGLDNYIYYVGARPGMGKTIFASSLMLSIARGGVDDYGRPLNNGKSGVFCSFEMDKEQLVLRMLAAESGVPFKAIVGECMRPEQWSSVLAAVDRLMTIPISLSYMPGAHVSRVRSVMKREFRRIERKLGAKPGIGAVDYVTLVKGDKGKNDSRENEIAFVSRNLMKLPKEFSCPIVGLAQLNRDLEKRPNKRPILADLRESGALEQDGYGVWFLYRDWVYNPDTADETDAEVIIAKARNGNTGTVRVRFEGDKMRFVSVNQALYDQCDDLSSGLPLEAF